MSSSDTSRLVGDDFATLAAAYFQAEEGVADGFNSSAMLWDAGGGGLFASRASPLALARENDGAANSRLTGKP